METIKKTISKAYSQNYIKEMECFGYTLIDKIDENNNVFLTFERDDNAVNYLKLKELEEKYYSFKLLPFWPIIVFTSLAFILITIFLVFLLIYKKKLDYVLFSLLLLLPSSLLLIAATIYTRFRFKSFSSYSEFEKEKVNILKQAKELRNEEK